MKYILYLHHGILTLAESTSSVLRPSPLCTKIIFCYYSTNPYPIFMLDGSFERGWTGDYPALSLYRIFFLNPSIMIPATFHFFILVAMDSTFAKVSSQPKSLHEYSCHSVR